LTNVIRAIRVRDANGDELALYEYAPPASYLAKMGLNRPPAARLALDTGEEAERIDDDTFVLVATGEQLTRIG
jgi:3-oxoacyl-[acyl-carrier-protein] synthase III